MANLKRILAQTPLHMVYLSSWLEEQGVPPKSIFDHKRYGWLKPIGRGAYVKSGTEPDIHAGLNALQYQADYELHIGGRYALDSCHNVRQYLKSMTFELFSSERKALPKWFANTFAGMYTLRKTSFLPEWTGLEEIETDGIKIKISSRERALIEMLYTVPEQTSSHEAFQIFELMTVLKPDLVNTLLQSCKSVKVKRLFMYFASETGYPWVKKIEKTNLGSGVRVIDKNGKYNKTYNLIINGMKDD